jgi:Tol biopolymer transport system component
VTLLLLASAMLGIAMSAASGRSHTGAAAWGRIAFSYRFWPEDTRIVDNYEIFAMDVGTGSDENITRNPQCDEVDPAWSRSGRWIAFACQTGPSVGLFIMRDNRTRRQRVVLWAPHKTGGEPAWSPDGRRLAFRGSGSRGIWVVNADGTGLRRLTRRADGSPTWSADGRSIAFHRAAQVFTIPATGGRLVRIARNACCPAWSPDGRSIAFVRNGSLWIMRSDGRGKYSVPGVRRGLEITDLAWSPDGRYVAYYVYCCREGGIYITTLDGIDRERLPSGAEFAGISWGA